VKPGNQPIIPFKQLYNEKDAMLPSGFDLSLPATLGSSATPDPDANTAAVATYSSGRGSGHPAASGR